MNDKSTNVDPSNNHVRDTERAMRLPVIDIDIEDMSDPGGTLVRYVQKMHPDQKQFYCYEATDQQKELYPSAG